jgi:hemerythrin-like domain-containing protein
MSYSSVDPLCTEQRTRCKSQRSSLCTRSGLHQLLHGHTVREEVGVFTQLRNADVDDRYVARFQADHDDVRLLLSAGDEDWRPTVANLVNLLNEHIEREETDLFPAAHQLLTPARWADVSIATTLQPS